MGWGGRGSQHAAMPLAKLAARVSQWGVSPTRRKQSVSPTRRKQSSPLGSDDDAGQHGFATQGPALHSPGSAPGSPRSADSSGRSERRGSIAGSSAGSSAGRRTGNRSPERVRFADSDERLVPRGRTHAETSERVPQITRDEKALMHGFVKRFCESQRVAVTCDSTQMFSSVHVSLPGARQGGTTYHDGRLFSVFQEHGGGDAAELARLELSRHFYHIAGRACFCSPKDEPTHDHCSCEDAYTHLTKSMPDSHTPLVVAALDKSYKETQATLETRLKASSGSGTTGLTCWLQRTALLSKVNSSCSSSSGSSAVSLASASGSGAEVVKERTRGKTGLKVYVACCGNGHAFVMDSRTGLIPALPTRTWDDAQDTLYEEAAEIEAAAVTEVHKVTGALRSSTSQQGVAITQMHNDARGTGLRELDLLCDLHPELENEMPRSVSDAFGKVSWRILDEEPTRALGHTQSQLHPLRSPEIYEWQLEAPDSLLLLLLGAGFISQNVFKSPDELSFFLADPEAFCKRSDFFVGTCMESTLSQDGRKLDLSSMTRGTMPQLFMAIHEIAKDFLTDELMLERNVSALRYLIQFAQQKPVPNVRTAPACTLLAAAHLAVLMLSQETMMCTLIMLDGGNMYGGKRFTLGHGAPHPRVRTF